MVGGSFVLSCLVFATDTHPVLHEIPHQKSGFASESERGDKKKKEGRDLEGILFPTPIKVGLVDAKVYIR